MTVYSGRGLLIVRFVSLRMSHEVSAGPNRGHDVSTHEPSVDADLLLDLLADDDIRELFERTGNRRTVPELASACDLPRSTAYRKVKRLVEAELLMPTTRGAGDTGTATEYRRTVESVEITIEGETTVEFS